MRLELTRECSRTSHSLRLSVYLFFLKKIILRFFRKLFSATTSLWCDRRESNSHGNAPTASSRLRVYLFRHDHVMVDPAGLEPATNRLWADDSDQLS